MDPCKQLLVISAVIMLLIEISKTNDDGCNEFVCGSIVSKCLLTQSCQCKLLDCHCCKDCLNCLGTLYTECCGCLDMCPKNNVTLGGLFLRSEIGDIDGVPELFETITADNDDDQWATIRFPMSAGLKRRVEMTVDTFGRTSTKANVFERNPLTQKSSSIVNCTVIYLNSCVPANKCLRHCESMGANSYRWFHDGCCQCVGANCFNYGINESRCRACPEDDQLSESEGFGNNDEQLENELGFNDEDSDSLLENDMWDYGDTINNYN